MAMTCPHCGESLDVSLEDLGNVAEYEYLEAECPYCQKTFRIQTSSLSQAEGQPNHTQTYSQTQPKRQHSQVSSYSPPQSQRQYVPTGTYSQPQSRKKFPLWGWICIFAVIAFGVIGMLVVIPKLKQSLGGGDIPTEVKYIFDQAASQKKSGHMEFCGFYIGMAEKDFVKLVNHYGLSYSTLSGADITYEIKGDHFNKHIESIEFTFVALQRITKCGSSVQEVANAVASRIGPMANDIPSPGTRIRYDNVYGETAIFSHDIKHPSLNGLILMGP